HPQPAVARTERAAGEQVEPALAVVQRLLLELRGVGRGGELQRELARAGLLTTAPAVRRELVGGAAAERGERGQRDHLARRDAAGLGEQRGGVLARRVEQHDG